MDGAWDRYVPLTTNEVREGSENVALLLRGEPAHRQPAVGGRPYAATVDEYAEDESQHHVYAGQPVANFLTPDLVNEDDAVVRVAERLGLTPSDMMQQFGTIWQLMRAHHQEVTHVELKSLQRKVESAMYAIIREIAATQAELADVGQEARAAQVQEARTMVFVGGWPKDTPPHVRAKLIMDSVVESGAIKGLIWDTLWVDTEDLEEDELIRQVLLLVRGLPTTIR